MVYIDCCDGNFGIFKDRDYEIAKRLAEVKNRTGAPERINLTWTKSSSEKIMPAAKILSESGMLRAVSLSVQSLNKTVLKAVKRSNIKFDKFENLVRVFEEADIQSYTELIMGLPEETLETYKNNWEILAAIYPQPAIMAWNCSVFVNAPMNNPEYRKKYGIEVFESPMFMQHSSSKKEEIKEYEKMVKATTSLPAGKIKDVYLYNWIMMVFNSFGILYYISRFYNKKFGLSYTRFYELLVEYCAESDGIFSREYEKAQAHAANGYAGGGWDHYDDELGDISWPIEEASWLRLVRQKEILKTEITQFLGFLATKEPTRRADEELVKDLIGFQLFSINFPADRFSDRMESGFKNQWHLYFENAEDNDLQNKEIMLYKETKASKRDIILWGYESIWFGRRSCRYKTKIKEMKETFSI